MMRGSPKKKKGGYGAKGGARKSARMAKLGAARKAGKRTMPLAGMKYGGAESDMGV